MLKDYEDQKRQDYVQKIHDIIFSKQHLMKQKIYNIFTAIYAKKKLEVAEENYEQGLNEFYLENFDKAKECFEQAVTLSPYNKEYRDCLKQIRKEENKALAEEIATLGIEQLNKGNANKAVKYFDEAIDMYECAKYYFLRGKAFLSQGSITLYDKSVYNFNKAISLVPNNSEYYFYCGKAHFSRYKYDEALECFTKAVNLKNDNWEYYYNRGLANYEISNYADSIDDYCRCISLNYDILKDENVLYAIKDTIDKVENISNNNENVIRLKAIMTQGNEYVEYANKGCNYVEKNDFKNAINYFNKSLEINPNYKFAYINRATTYTKLKEYQNAINDYSKVIDLDANWADAYRFRGLTYYDMDLYNEAISDFNVALQLNNMDAYSYYVRGAAYLMNKVQGSAIRDFVSASIIDESYVNKISESTNINLMSVMDILKNTPHLSEQETSNVIQLIQEMSDEDLGLPINPQESVKDNVVISQKSIRKIDL